MITTKDGNVFAGTVVKRDNQAVTLRDATSRTEVIPTSNVAKSEIQPVSLMPPGLTPSLRRDEFCDLVKFMSELGREGAFKVPPQTYVRRWRILHPTDDIGRAHNLGGDRLFVSDEPISIGGPITARWTDRCRRVRSRCSNSGISSNAASPSSRSK